MALALRLPVAPDSSEGPGFAPGRDADQIRELPSGKRYSVVRNEPSDVICINGAVVRIADVKWTRCGGELCGKRLGGCCKWRAW